MFTALTFEDILREERDRVTQEVNHCHGPGRGHPCESTGVRLLGPKEAPSFEDAYDRAYSAWRDSTKYDRMTAKEVGDLWRYRMPSSPTTSRGIPRYKSYRKMYDRLTFSRTAKSLRDDGIPSPAELKGKVHKGTARLVKSKRNPVHEVNHCHGHAPGHPCTTGSKAPPKPKAKRLWPFGIPLTRTPKRTWPKLTTAGQFVRETWSDASRAAAIAARRAKAGAQQLSKTADEKVQAGKAADASLRSGLAARRQAKDAEAKKAAAAKKSSGSKAASDAKKATSEKFDAQITAAAKNLKALAAKGTDTPEYQKAYAAYKDLQDQKREALGGGPSVKAPTKPKAEPKPKAASKPKPKPMPKLRD